MSTFNILGITESDLSGPVADQWAFVRRSFLRGALAHHPDRGGDTDMFRQIHDAWETMKMQSHAGAPVDTPVGKRDFKFGVSSKTCEEAYNGPLYKFEPTPSGRSTCRGCQSFITMGDLRVSAFCKATGGFAWSRHVTCWSVPRSVLHALGLHETTAVKDKGEILGGLADIDDILITGFNNLTRDHQDLVATRIGEPCNWAKETKGNKVDPLKPRPTKRALGAITPAVSVPTPKTGQKLLAGAKVVLTGTFKCYAPGSVGLNAGKDEIKGFVQSLGGAVVGSLSKKVTHLIVGDLPGQTKLDQAASLGIRVLKASTLMTNVESGGDVLALNRQVDSEPRVEIAPDDCSRGFGNNAKRFQLECGEAPLAIGRVVSAFPESPCA